MVVVLKVSVHQGSWIQVDVGGGVRGVGEREKNWSYTYLVEHFEM